MYIVYLGKSPPAMALYMSLMEKSGSYKLAKGSNFSIVENFTTFDTLEIQ